MRLAPNVTRVTSSRKVNLCEVNHALEEWARLLHANFARVHSEELQKYVFCLRYVCQSLPL